MGGARIIPPAAIFFSLLTVLVLINKIAFKKNELVLLLFLVVTIFLYKVFGYNVDVAAMFVTWVIPVFVCFLWRNLNQQNSALYLRKIFYVFYFTECGMAIVERVLHRCFFPNLLYETGFNLSKEGFRSYALLGHPLSNSALILTMLCGILLFQKSEKIKMFALLMGFVAVLCFNSRFVFVILSIVYSIYFFHHLFLERSAFVAKLQLTIYVGLLLTSVIFLLLHLGVGDRLVSMGLLDESSAAVRWKLFDIFTGAHWYDFLFPVSGAYYQHMMRYFEYGIIENCWVIFLLRYGALYLISLLFLYSRFILDVFKSATKVEICVMWIPWLVNVSSSNSLASASFSIMFVILTYLILKDDVNK